jgi:hypothetical protein
MRNRGIEYEEYLKCDMRIPQYSEEIILYIGTYTVHECEDHPRQNSKFPINKEKWLH